MSGAGKNTRSLKATQGVSLKAPRGVSLKASQGVSLKALQGESLKVARGEFLKAPPECSTRTLSVSDRWKKGCEEEMSAVSHEQVCVNLHPCCCSELGSTEEEESGLRARRTRPDTTT